MKPSRGHHYRIAVIGLWHLGEIYSAGLASLGHEVVGIDGNARVVEDLGHGIPPLVEPGLAQLIKKEHAAGRLRYTTDLSAAKDTEVVWLTFDTEVNDRDESDLAPIFATLKELTPLLKNEVTIVISSQIPVGTSAEIMRDIRAARPSLGFHYVYSPENLRLGEALTCFLKPERVVVGASDGEGLATVKNIFMNTRAKIVPMTPASAEMTKHTLNSFFATSISFINDIADMCERTGADVADVIAALRSDPRVGERAALGAGLGFSGGTLGRDLVSLIQLAKKNKIALPVVENVFKKNLGRPTALLARLKSVLGTLRGKRVTLYGLTYKPGTTTLRRSRSLEVARLLARTGVTVALCDPHVDVVAIPKMNGMCVVQDIYAAAEKADALVFATPWPDFRTLHFSKIARAAKKGAIVLDGTNFLRAEEELIKKAGLAYYGMGR